MDKDIHFFSPPRRQGQIFHAIGLAILVIGTLVLFLQATRPDTELGPVFLLSLFGALVLVALIPVFAYRLYALNRSSYRLERDGIRLKWGLRQVHIPITEVLWVRLSEDLSKFAMPWPHWRGSVVGVRRQTDPEVSQVEFMASRREQLILIGTPEMVYAISPEDRNRFLHAFQEQTELGSFSPLAPYSVRPSFMLIDVWRSRSARVFLSISLIFSLGLFIWVGLAVPSISTVSLGYFASGNPLPPVPSVQLFLLPVVNLLLLLAGYVLAAYFHREVQDHPITYVIWISTTVMSFLFLVAVYFILQNP